MSSALSIQKRRAIQPQSDRKRTAATENQATKAKKPDAIFVNEEKIENADKHAAPAITTFASYLHAMQSLIGRLHARDQTSSKCAFEKSG